MELVLTYAQFLSLNCESQSVTLMIYDKMFSIEDDTFVGTDLERFYCCYLDSLQGVEPTSSANCAALPTMRKANSVQFPKTVEGTKRKFLLLIL